MNSFAERLRIERTRLDLSQQQFAEAGGVQRRAQAHYESGERTPDAAYLAALAQIGVDLLYVLTGERNTSELSADESDLVRRYREAPTAVRAAAVAALAAGTSPTKYQQNFTGANIGQQVSGDVTGPFSINMGSPKGKKKGDTQD